MARDQTFDEIRVYEGIAERTGATVDRETVRRSQTFCRSVSDLTRKARRMGDGTFYLASSLWPENTTEIVLHQTWIPIS
ncbi:MAG TPA: hypothetical protein VMS56_07315 [Thermoanaerobaculia bacterium]|nr:hypothetical protein [Thermoanaerobaculia bacterium]